MQLDLKDAPRATRFRFLAVAPESGPGRYLAKLASELQYVGVILKMLLRWRPDVVHFQWLPIPVLDRNLGRVFGRPRVLTAHDLAPRDAREELVELRESELGGERFELHCGQSGACELAFDNLTAVGNRLLDLLLPVPSDLPPLSLL